MKAIIFILLIGTFSLAAKAQVEGEITEKRNIYNKKGDFYFDKSEYKNAILYYTLAYKQDNTDYFSILKKAEAYTKLDLFPQAEACYKFVLESGLRYSNVYNLKYALVLLENNKQAEFKTWLERYSQIVEEEIMGKNVLISSESRVKLYKDTLVVLESGQQVDTVHFKIKYAGYQFKNRSGDEDAQIFVILSSGDEYAISASASDDFKFSFQPMEEYKLVIRRENIAADNIIDNAHLTASQKSEQILKPSPIQKGELLLETGMKYQFSSGKYQISPEYLNTVREMARSSSNSDESTVDLTALVKELQLSEGEVYTIKFTREIKPGESSKKLVISTLTMNDRTINIYGQSFLMVLPDRASENFAIQTDIEELKKNFNPKKQGLRIDNAPLLPSVEELESAGLISLTINTDSRSDVVAGDHITAKEVSIVPGHEYILSLSKPDPATGENIEVFVPLTRGVKYNLTSTEGSSIQYKEALAEFLTGRGDIQLVEEEVINISMLSKELEVFPGEQVNFSLQPVKSLTKTVNAAEEVKSSLTVDEMIYEISRNDKLAINIPFNRIGKMNIQTDLEYVKDNFDPGAYTLRLDTIAFAAEIKVDTTGYGAKKSSGWLSMSVNSETTEGIEERDQFIANEVSIIPGNEYILTVSKRDAKTGEKEDIIIPLLRDVRYDFTSNPMSEEVFKASLENFMDGYEDLETSDGTMIDITILSKELQIEEDDEISFSLLPVRKLPKGAVQKPGDKSSLLLDDKVVEFTYIHKYSINIPLDEQGKLSMQTNLQHIRENFNPGSVNIDVDTLSFFKEIIIDTSGIGDRKVEEITDPVFDVVVVNFNVNEHSLRPAAITTIQQKVVEELRKDTRLYVTIKGYTDALGDADYNLRLSKQRAESVQEYLIDNGIGKNRIRTFSFGESQSLQDGIDWEDLSEEELKKHRKVEIVIYLPE